MIERKNFTGQVTPSIIDTTYKDCNFSQPQPIDSGGGVFVGVRLFPGNDTPRTFIDCNLINAEPPPGSAVTGGNQSVIQRGLNGVLETVVIAGETVDIQHRIDRVHGQWEPGGYAYKPTPVDVEVE